MATTGFFNGVKKQIRKIVKPIDVRVGKYNNNLKKTNAFFPVPAFCQALAWLTAFT